MHENALFCTFCKKKYLNHVSINGCMKNPAIDGFLIVKRQKAPGRGYGWGL